MPIKQTTPGVYGLTTPRIEPVKGFFDDAPDLKRIQQAPYSDDWAKLMTGNRAPGSILGGPNTEQKLLRLADPSVWSYTPPKLGTTSVFDPSVKAGSKLGTFNLNMVDWMGTFDSAASGVGLNGPGLISQAGAAAQGPVMGLMEWQGSLPVRLIDHAIGIPMRIAGIGMPNVDAGAEGGRFSFQNDPRYWSAVSTMNDEQIAAQAKNWAGLYLQPGEAGSLTASLITQMKKDREEAWAYTSGNEQTDYLAKIDFSANLAQQQVQREFGIPYEEAYKAYLAGDNGRAAEAWRAYDAVEHEAFGLRTAATLVSTTPFIGTALASKFAPIHPIAEELWKQLSPAERRTYLDAQALPVMGAQMLGMALLLPLGGGAGALMKAGSLGRMIESIPAIAKTVGSTGMSIYNVTLKTTNALMAAGIVESLAVWSAQQAGLISPEYGKYLDDAAPISSQPILGPVMNNLGFFASGTFGAATAARWARMAASGAADLEAAGFSRLGMKTGRLGSLALPRPIFGIAESGFYRAGFGGSELVGKLADTGYATVEQMESSLRGANLSYLQHATDKLALNDYLQASKGAEEAVGLSAETVADLQRFGTTRQARAAELLKSIQAEATGEAAIPGSLQARLGATARKAFGGNPAIHDWSQKMWRTLDKEATQSFTRDYGTMFSFDLAELKGQVVARMKASLTPAEVAAFDVGRLEKSLGSNIADWQAAGRIAHQRLFDLHAAELRTAVEGSHEQAAAIWSQRTLFQRDIQEALPVLTGKDRAAAQALADDLLARKAQVAHWYAEGMLGKPSLEQELLTGREHADPTILADLLEQLHDVVPRARELGENPAAGPLNELHQRLVDEGLWTIGFRGKIGIPAEVRLQSYIDRFLSEPEYVINSPAARREPTNVMPDGYRALRPGERYRHYDWGENGIDYHYLLDGTPIVRDEGARAQPVVAQSAGVTYAHTVPPDAIDSLRELEYESSSAPLADGTKPPTQLYPTGETLSGNNPGATWPVLTDPSTGEQWLFKAAHDYDGTLRDVENFRGWGEVLVTTLGAKLGLSTGEARWYVHNGVTGTIQPKLDVSGKLNWNRLAEWEPEELAAVQEHHVFDWLTSQLDTNRQAILPLANGKIAGIDKAQAFKFFGREGEQDLFLGGESFWTQSEPGTFYPGQRTSRHTGQHVVSLELWDAVQAGEIVLDRGVVEELLQKVESIPNDVWREYWSPLAAAREEQGWGSAESFLDAVTQRKDQLRQAVNKAYEAAGSYGLQRPGDFQSFRPGARGTAWIPSIGHPEMNSDPTGVYSQLLQKTLLEPIPEPEFPPTADHSKAGVVIVEDDGKVWTIMPKTAEPGEGHGVVTWPKGMVDTTKAAGAPGSPASAGETAQYAAVREAMEETGFAVQLKAYLADAPNAAGNMTRYYVAERRAGGPQYVRTPEEIGTVNLTSIDSLDVLLQGDRDKGVLEALRKYLGDTKEADAANLADGHVELGSNAAAEAEVPMQDIYATTTRLRNGHVITTPWMEYPGEAANWIQLGNRNFAGGLLDATFRGWHSYRIAEFQRITLQRMGQRYIGVTAEQLDAFNAGMLDLSRRAHVNPQTLAGVSPAMPMVGHWADEVTKLAKDTFGRDRFIDRRTHAEVTVDWRKLAVEAYRQSYRMNLTAGFTSHLKAMPLIGSTTTVFADVMYPLIRFGLSPLFKLGEVVESPMLNAMRGVNPTGDPFLNMAESAGLIHNRDQLREELAMDSRTSALTRLYSPDQEAPQSSSWLGARPNPMRYGVLRANEIRAEQGRSPWNPGSSVPPPDLSSSLYGRAMDGIDAAKFPSTYGDVYNDFPHFLPRDAAGEIVRDGRAVDAELQETLWRKANDQMYQDLIGGANPEKWAGAAAFLDSIPPSQIAAIAEVVPITHTQGNWSTVIDNLRAAMDNNYMPLAGMGSRGTTAAVEATTMGTGRVQFEQRWNIGEGEAQVGFGDAVYASAGQSSWGGGSNPIFVIKPEMMQRSITTDRDRIGIGADLADYQQSQWTPAGVVGGNRIQMQAALRDFAIEGEADQTFLDWITSERGGGYSSVNAERYWNTSSGPFEFAFMHGVEWDGIETIVLPATAQREWEAFVAQYKDSARGKGLETVPVVYFDDTAGLYGSDYKAAQRAMWGDAFQRAGLTDLAQRTAELPPHADVLAHLPDAAITPASAPMLTYRLDESLRRAGVGKVYGLGTVDELTSLIATTRHEISKQEADLQTAQMNARGVGAYPPPQEAERLVVQSRSRLAQWEALRTDVTSLFDEGVNGIAYRSFNEASRALRSDDPAVQAAAEAWINRAVELNTRAQALGPQYGHTGNVTSVGDLNDWAAESHLTFADTENGLVLHSEDLPRWTDDPASFGEREAYLARESLSALRARTPEGYWPQDTSWYSNYGAADSIAEAVVPARFVDALQRFASEKAGVELQRPIVRVYLRGDSPAIISETEAADLVVSITDVNGGAYPGVGLTDVMDLWRNYGAPKEIADAVAAGRTPAELAETGYTQNLWTAEGGPAGSIVHYGSWRTPGGQFETALDGTPHYRDNGAGKPMPVIFDFGFTPNGKSYLALTGDRTLWRTDEVQVAHKHSSFSQDYDDVTAKDRQGGTRYGYRVWLDENGANRATIDHSETGRFATEAALRDVFDRYGKEPLRIELGKSDEAAFGRLFVRGEVPTEFVAAVDEFGRPFDLDALRERFGMSRKTIDDLNANAPTPDMRDVQGTGEAVTAELGRILEQQVTMAESTAHLRRAKDVLDAWVNPVPMKNRQQDLLTLNVLRREAPGAIEKFAPGAYGKYVDELKVPPRHLVDFILEDRKLLDRWLTTGAHGDFAALVQHANKYTGEGERLATRDALDELYMNPEFDALLGALRITAKTAQEESFAVHFFSPYRSTFERSINHPLFGVYPASWAYKAAKEWSRFLFRNETLGIHLGMAPAVILGRWAHAQSADWARTHQGSLADEYTKGPYNDLWFMANLVMPGDWSSLPFPLSRSVRDGLRGTLDPTTIAGDTFTAMGLFRDLRLSLGGSQAVLNEASGANRDKLIRNMGASNPGTRPPTFGGGYTTPLSLTDR